MKRQQDLQKLILLFAFLRVAVVTLIGRVLLATLVLVVLSVLICTESSKDKEMKPSFVMHDGECWCPEEAVAGYGLDEAWDSLDRELKPGAPCRDEADVPPGGLQKVSESDETRSPESPPQRSLVPATYDAPSHLTPRITSNVSPAAALRQALGPDTRISGRGESELADLVTNGTNKYQLWPSHGALNWVIRIDGTPASGSWQNRTGSYGPGHDHANCESVYFFYDGVAHWCCPAHGTSGLEKMIRLNTGWITDPDSHGSVSLGYLPGEAVRDVPVDRVLVCLNHDIPNGSMRYHHWHSLCKWIYYQPRDCYLGFFESRASEMGQLAIKRAHGHAVEKQESLNQSWAEKQRIESMGDDRWADEYGSADDDGLDFRVHNNSSVAP